jgi:hypothetical protein
MATVSSQPSIGPLLREWRERRRLSQLADQATAEALADRVRTKEARGGI